MICYRDMTFCSALCGTEDCTRNFTDDDRQKAEKWWEGCAGGPPIAFADFSDGCPHYTPAPEAATDTGGKG